MIELKVAADAVAHVAAAPRARVVFIDLLRVVAAFQMVQGHVIDAVLAPAYRTGFVYGLWTQVRGLTSVAFLFAAGFSFYLASSRAWIGGVSGASARASAAAARRLRRALRLIALGYVLHFPVAALLTRDASTRIASLIELAAVDVLQCIGVSLVLVEMMARSLRTPRGLGLACAGLATFAFALSPLLAQLPATGMWRPLLAYLTPQAGSLFPLLPWSAHLLLGVGCAAWLGNRPPLQLAYGLAAGACGLLLVVRLLEHVIIVPSPATLVTAHVGRLAWVLLASSALAAFAHGMRRVPPMLAAFSAETLFMYVFHVLLVYGAGVGLADQVGERLAPGAAVALAGLVLLFTFGLSLAYRRVLRGRLAVGAVAG